MSVETNTAIARNPAWLDETRRLLYQMGCGPITAAERASVTLTAGSLYGAVPDIEVSRFATRFCDAVLQSKPTWLDAATVTSAYGVLEISTRQRDQWFEHFFYDVGDTREQIDRTRLLVAFDDALVAIETARVNSIARLAQGVLAVHIAASQLLHLHLFATEQLVVETKARFPAIRGTYVATAPLNLRDLRTFMTAARELTTLRRAADLDKLSGSNTLVRAVALGLALTPLARLSQAASAAHGVATLAFTVEEGWRPAFESLGIVKKDEDKVRATAQFVQRWQDLATAHPILLVIDLDELGLLNPSDVKASEAGVIDLVYRALDKVDESITNLRAAANQSTQAMLTSPQTSTTVADLLASVESSGPLAVWRLPFFVPTALDNMPPRVKAEVSALLAEDAEKHDRDAAHQQAASAIIQAISTLVAPLGPYGAVAAFLFATGDFLLRRSLGAAERTLYSASLQVNRLLRRGDTAEDPGQLADIANLAVQGVMLRRIIIAGGR